MKTLRAIFHLLGRVVKVGVCRHDYRYVNETLDLGIIHVHYRCAKCGMQQERFIK